MVVVIDYINSTFGIVSTADNRCACFFWFHVLCGESLSFGTPFSVVLMLPVRFLLRSFRHLFYLSAIAFSLGAVTPREFPFLRTSPDVLPFSAN
jgi:hypothetical protein